MTPQQQAARDRAVEDFRDLVHAIAPMLGEESRDTVKRAIEAAVDHLVEACTPEPSEHAETRCPAMFSGMQCDLPAGHAGSHSADGFTGFPKARWPQLRADGSER